MKHKEKLVRCLRCPTAYHHNDHCMTAGTLIITKHEILCPKHFKPTGTVPMVLNPNGIEPTFLILDSRSPGAGFIPIKLYREKRIQEKKKTVLCIQKTFNAVFKNGFNPFLGSIPRLPTGTSKKKNYHVNASWCFMCSEGGSLICCEICPAAFHLECLKLG